MYMHIQNILWNFNYIRKYPLFEIPDIMAHVISSSLPQGFALEEKVPSYGSSWDILILALHTGTI